MNTPFLSQYGFLNPYRSLIGSQRLQDVSLSNLPYQTRRGLLIKYEHSRLLQLHQNNRPNYIQTSYLTTPTTQTSLYKQPDFSIKTEDSSGSYDFEAKEESINEKMYSTQFYNPNVLDSSTFQYLANTPKKHSLILKKDLVDPKNVQSSEKDYLKIQISNMIDYFIKSFGKEKPEDTNRQKALYESDKRLLRVFDTLIKKYSSTGKCREDMSRFAMRRALTFLTDQERKVSNCRIREASLALCRKYFDKKLISSLSDQELLNELLPYKKNSKNKTPNFDFTTKIFASKAFCSDFQLYLSKFREIMEKDNSRKITKFREFLLCCIEQNNFDRIDKYKRLPWLEIWIESTYVVANEVLLRNSVKHSQEIASEIEGQRFSQKVQQKM